MLYQIVKTHNFNIKRNSTIRCTIRRTKTEKWNWGWSHFIMATWKREREILPLGCYLARTIIWDPPTIIRKTCKRIRDWFTRPKFLNHFQVHQNQDKLSLLITLPIITIINPSSRRIKIVPTEARPTKNGATTIQTKRDSTALLRHSPNTSSKVNSPNKTPFTKTSGSNWFIYPYP